MRDKIKEFNSSKELLKQELKKYVTNREISLDERWNLFFESDLGDHSTSIEDFLNLDSDDIASVRDFNRHEIVDLESIIEWEIESIKDEDCYDKFREDVLRKFIKSYEWDW